MYLATLVLVIGDSSKLRETAYYSVRVTIRHIGRIGRVSRNVELGVI